jgi:hypothetical protein
MRPRAIVLALLAGSLATLAPAFAQSGPAAGFTYQGKLEDGSALANGNYDFFFTLHDAPSGGAQVAALGSAASPITINVQRGLFTRQLDFPASAWSGGERYLEVNVRQSPSGSFTTLASRQRISPAPYANFSANTRGMSVDTTGRFQFGPYATSYRGIVGDAAQGELLELRSNNANFTLMTLTNGSAGGRPWALLSTGAGWSTGAGDLVFRDIGAAQDRMVLGSDGNVGVGAFTLNPAAYGRTLTISGSGTAGGSASAVFHNPNLNQQWNAGIGAAGVFYFDKFGGGSNVVSVPVLEIRGGSDIAEPYHIAPASNIRPQPGMVVVIDQDTVGTLKVASKSYDHAVAGIISGANGVNTGLTLTQKGSSVADGDMPVANVGRVWCYVDADANGSIKAGDLLTTSDTPGHAMWADPAKANGAILGKAMSSLDAGKGLVLVLVGLQ